MYCKQEKITDLSPNPKLLRCQKLSVSQHWAGTTVPFPQVSFLAHSFLQVTSSLFWLFHGQIWGPPCWPLGPHGGWNQVVEATANPTSHSAISPAQFWPPCPRGKRAPPIVLSFTGCLVHMAVSGHWGMMLGGGGKAVQVTYGTFATPAPVQHQHRCRQYWSLRVIT